MANSFFAKKKREAKSLVTGSDAYVLNRKKYNKQEHGCACYLHNYFNARKCKSY